MENAFAPKIESVNKDTMISGLDVGPQEVARKSIGELSEPFSDQDNPFTGEVKKISEVREKQVSPKTKVDFSEAEQANMQTEAMEYIARGWVFGIDKLMEQVSQKSIESPEFQEAVKQGMIKALQEFQADNAIEIKTKYLKSLDFLDDSELNEAALNAYDKYKAAGNLEMMEEISREFLSQKQDVAV